MNHKAAPLRWNDPHFSNSVSMVISCPTQPTKCDTCYDAETGPHGTCHYMRDPWGNSYANMFRDGAGYQKHATGFSKHVAAGGR